MSLRSLEIDQSVGGGGCTIDLWPSHGGWRPDEQRRRGVSPLDPTTPLGSTPQKKCTVRGNSSAHDAAGMGARNATNQRYLTRATQAAENSTVKPSLNRTKS